MKNMIARFINEEAGQDLIEYALLAGFISIVAVTAIIATGTAVNGLFEDVQAKVEQAGGED
jgi:pilus assembly protein Flp/PilA